MKAKSNLSELLRKAENGEEVLIRRGRKGKLFRIIPVHDDIKRSLQVNPRWKEAIRYNDEDIWESEWKEEE